MKVKGGQLHRLLSIVLIGGYTSERGDNMGFCQLCGVMFSVRNYPKNKYFLHSNYALYITFNWWEQTRQLSYSEL